MQEFQVVEVLRPDIWIESDVGGGRHVMIQYEGMPPCQYASFKYQYPYTDNATIRATAEKMALSLGATEPIRHTNRPFPTE